MELTHLEQQNRVAVAPKVALHVGVAGPVGSGKTTIVESLSRELTRLGYEVAVVTNDIFTQEDAEFLRRSRRLAAGSGARRRDRWLPAQRRPR